MKVKWWEEGDRKGKDGNLVARAEKRWEGWREGRKGRDVEIEGGRRERRVGCEIWEGVMLGEMEEDCIMARWREKKGKGNIERRETKDTRHLKGKKGERKKSGLREVSKK